MTENRLPPVGRRALLAAGVSATVMPLAARADPLDIPQWSRVPGRPVPPYGLPARHEADTTRAVVPLFPDIAPGVSVATTPLERLEGIITPNGLHFVRNHGGVPDIDPAQHRLLIHGKVARPLTFDVDALARYPMVTRTCFIECAGNSFQHSLAQPRQLQIGLVHGLFSTAEWTGVPLSVLLAEAGLDADAAWLLAEGADVEAMSRSLPVAKAMQDCFVALYQNGERLRAENGYPMRLIVPGWQGNLQIKWLRRIKVTDGPTHTRDETSRYSLLKPDGTAQEFPLPMPVKSLITRPSYGQVLAGPGQYPVSGLAWTGSGSIETVEVSADGGKTWVIADLDGAVQDYAPVRFRWSWEWNGKDAVLQSRATDSRGHVQPTHAQWRAANHPTQRFHCNAIQSWSVDSDGIVENVFL